MVVNLALPAQPLPFDSPKPDHLFQFCALLAALQGQLFVHCIMNYRVSIFMYHYLRKNLEYSEPQARSPILDSWEIIPQWQAIMALDSVDSNLSRN